MISTVAVMLFFLLGYYQYKYLPFDEGEYLISSIMLIFLLMLTHYFIKQSERYQRKVETQNLQIAKQRDDLEASNSTKNQLFSIISHDLRGPITVLLGYNEMIEDHLRKTYKVENDKN